jgi:hypothetical protein
MNGISGFREVRSSTPRSSAYRLPREQRHQSGADFWHFLHTSLVVTGMLLCLSACSADLVVHNVKDTSVFNGIRVYSPANFKVTTTTLTSNCPPLTTQAIVQLPLGEPYDVTVNTSWFAKSEFSVLFNDAGLLKQVTVNSTPQLAETLTAMAALAKSIGEAAKPGVSMAQADCGTVLSEKIDKVERLQVSP